MRDEGMDRLSLKRYAFQIVAQLPESREEALRALEYARELVDWENERGPCSVLQLIG